MKIIGQRLREERKRLEFSQHALANLCDVAENAQGNYENGKRRPTATYLSLASGAGIDVVFVLTGTRAPIYLDAGHEEEINLLCNLRDMPVDSSSLIRHLLSSLATLTAAAPR
ncbi:helix-turn-helix domain-containing protein [Pseudomonas fluorescens]|uniref:helix-turn-helix domain-containing protein n=1 Tax=Pseudomonas fluorescens TaxID=294 RepID=UPI0012403C4F